MMNLDEKTRDYLQEKYWDWYPSGVSYVKVGLSGNRITDASIEHIRWVIPADRTLPAAEKTRRHVNVGKPGKTQRVIHEIYLPSWTKQYPLPFSDRYSTKTRGYSEKGRHGERTTDEERRLAADEMGTLASEEVANNSSISLVPGDRLRPSDTRPVPATIQVF